MKTTTTNIDAKAKKILNDSFDELVGSLQKVISFNTEKGVATTDAPFGKNIQACLDYTLGLASSFGLSTYNCDG